MWKGLRSRLAKFSANSSKSSSFALADTADQDLIRKIRAQNLTYLSEEKLARLAALSRKIEADGLPGIIIEAGCALGGSAILLASCKQHDRPLMVHDVFGMIPAPTRDDSQDVHERYREIIEGKSSGLGGDKYYGYIDNLYEVVIANLERFGIRRDEQAVSLVQGLVQDTLTGEQPVSLAHLDVDWYEPVLTCLQRIFPRLVPGGSIVIDDYHDWGGCRRATDEYLREVVGQFRLEDSAGSLTVTRLPT